MPHRTFGPFVAFWSKLDYNPIFDMIFRRNQSDIHKSGTMGQNFGGYYFQRTNFFGKV